MSAKNCHLFFCYHYHYKEKQGDVNIENKKITLGSLFDGIGIFPLAASHFGIEPVWVSEIDKNAIAVTKRHFPHMKHLGDIKKIDVRKTELVDIIAFGSPWQNLSLIGDRTGISGVKSSLFFEAIRIINEMRDYTNGLYPTFAVWENVAGSLVSGRRNDFRTILEAFTGSAVPMPHTKWANAGMVRRSELELCWRVLDAQYFGTPKLLQRRKRVFIVCDFRKRSAHKILYKPRHIKEDTKAVDKGGSTASKNYRKDTYKTGGEYPNVRAFEERRMRTGAKEKKPSVFLKGLGDINSPYPTLLAGSPAMIAFWYEGREDDGCIRYLTPMECERLMDFPDDYTKYSYTGATIKDSARLKAIGNSIALPCADYIFSGIKEVLEED